MRTFREDANRYKTQEWFVSKGQIGPFFKEKTGSENALLFTLSNIVHVFDTCLV